MLELPKWVYYLIWLVALCMIGTVMMLGGILFKRQVLTVDSLSLRGEPIRYICPSSTVMQPMIVVNSHKQLTKYIEYKVTKYKDGTIIEVPERGSFRIGREEFYYPWRVEWGEADRIIFEARFDYTQFKPDYSKDGFLRQVWIKDASACDSA